MMSAAQEKHCPVRLMDARPRKRCLIHFHIPRTRGTWLRRSIIVYLLKMCKPDQIFFVGGGPEWNCGYGSYNDLRTLDPVDRARLRFITGHMPIECLDLFDDPFVFTILRDPIERALSEYWYCYHTIDNPAHPFARRFSIGEYCRLGYGLAKNGQARYLAGTAYSGEVLTDDELYTRARETLKRLDLIGFHEHMDVFLERLAEQTGICDLVTSAEGRNAVERLRTPSPDDLVTIRQENAVDTMLFELARVLDKPALEPHNREGAAFKSRRISRCYFNSLRTWLQRRLE